MNITAQDINARILALGETDTNFLKPVSKTKIYSKDGKFLINNAKYVLENWMTLGSNTNESFVAALDIFGEACTSCNVTTINELCSILLEAEQKVRDAEGLKRSVKWKTSHVKSKISSAIDKTNDDATSAIKKVINNIDSKIAKVNPPKNKPQTPEEKATKEAFDKLFENANKISNIDRMIANYRNMSRRFNIDKVVSESYYDGNLNDGIRFIAEGLATYNMPFINKYNSALEISKFVLDKAHIQYDPKSIIETVTDYYIFSGDVGSAKYGITDIRTVAESSYIFNHDDFDCIRFLYETPIEESAEEQINGDVHDYGTEMLSITEGNLADKAKEYWGDSKSKENKQKAEVETMVNDFRKECAKTTDNSTMLMRLKGLVNKIYTKNPSQIVNETPKIFSIIRAGFICGVTGINPILGVVALITDYIIKMPLRQKDGDRIIKAYKDEIKKSEEKLEKATDDETKERLEAYIKELKKDLEKIDTYVDSLHTEEENDERKYGSDSDGDDDFDLGDDFDFDLDLDDDLDLDESALINAASVITLSDLVESAVNTLGDDTIDGIVCGNICKFTPDTIDTLTDFTLTVPVVLEKNKLCEALESYRTDLRHSSLDYNTIMAIDSLSNNIDRLSNSPMVYKENKSVDAAIYMLNCINEIAKLKSNPEYIMEMDFTNTLKLAVNNLKRDAIKLSDKDKQVSRTIDASVEAVRNGMESALMNDNREAIIKGRILPSASKTIKLALGIGCVSWVMGPTIAIITALGMFACSQHLKAKERQLVLDDIEIELNMCERYLRTAEDKGDMKAVRQIEITKRNLLRQQQRIKYKMRVDFKQTTTTGAPGSHTNNNND